MSTIKQSPRLIGRGVVATLAVALGSLAIASPSQAAPLLHCEAAGNYRFLCDADTSGVATPYTIKWYLAGSSHVPAWDNRQTVFGNCYRRNGSNTVRVAVTDATGTTTTQSRSFYCGPFAP